MCTTILGSIVVLNTAYCTLWDDTLDTHVYRQNGEQDSWSLKDANRMKPKYMIDAVSSIQRYVAK